MIGNIQTVDQKFRESLKQTSISTSRDLYVNIDSYKIEIKNNLLDKK